MRPGFIPPVPRREGRLHAALPWLILATLVAYAPVAWNGFPADAWDSRYHGVTAIEFSRQLWDGDLYPRWLMSMNAGLGSPHFFYYAPLGYYISSIFRLFGAESSFSQLGAAVVFLGLLSGITSYLWLARVLPHAAAVAGAIFYLASPNHVFVALLIRADYSEYAAMAFVPLALLGVELFLDRRAAGLPLIAFGIAAATLCSVVVEFIVAGLPLVYAVARLGWPPRPHAARTGLWVLAATALGIGLTAFYLVPALAYSPEVRMPIAEMLPKAFMFGTLDGTRLELFERIMFVAYAVLLAGLAGVAFRTGCRSSFFGVCGVLALLAFALMGIWARPLWLMLPITWTVQFTSRLFLLLDLFASGLIGVCVASLARRYDARVVATAMGGATLCVAACAAVVAVHAGVFDINAGLWSKRLAYAADYGLFRPKTVQAPLPADGLPLYNGGQFDTLPPLPPRVQAVDGEARIEVTEWRPRHIGLELTATGAGSARIGQLYVPGWRAIDADSGLSRPVSPSPGEGLVTISYPAGTRHIELTLAARPPEPAGVFISLACLVLLAVPGLLRRRRTMAMIRARLS